MARKETPKDNSIKKYTDNQLDKNVPGQQQTFLPAKQTCKSNDDADIKSIN